MSMRSLASTRLGSRRRFSGVDPDDGAALADGTADGTAVGAARRSAVLAEPTLLFILVAGLVQIARGYAADIALFFGTAALLVWDAGRSPAIRAVPRPAPARLRARTGMVLSTLAFGFLVSWLPRDAPALHLAFAVPGLAVVWGLLRRPAPGTVDRSADGTTDGASDVATDSVVPGRAWLVWLFLGLLLALIELGSFLSQPDARTDNPSHPTVSTVVEPWLDGQAARALVLAVWLAMGWWLYRRLNAWAGRR